MPVQSIMVLLNRTLHESDPSDLQVNSNAPLGVYYLDSLNIHM